MQPAGASDWIGEVSNRPLSVGDKLWSDRASRAELHIGSTALRLSANTGVELLALDDARLQVRLSAGTVQLHVRRLDPGQSIELATRAGP